MMNRRSLFKYLGIATLTGLVKNSVANNTIKKQKADILYLLQIEKLIEVSENLELYIYLGKPGLDPLFKKNQIEYTEFANKNNQWQRNQPITFSNEDSIHPIFVTEETISIAIQNKRNETLYSSNQVTLGHSAKDIVKPFESIYCKTFEDLRKTKPQYKFQEIQVVSHSSHVVSGGGLFYFDDTDHETPDNNGTVIVTDTGERWKRTIDSTNPFVDATWFGVTINLNIDSSDALQNAISEGERLVTQKKAKRVSIKLPSALNTAKPIYLNPAYTFLEPISGVTEWQVDNSSQHFKDNYALHICGNVLRRGEENDIPYVNTTIFALSHIYMFEKQTIETNRINCIKHYATLNNKKGISETVSQLGILKCRFTGFSDVYTNGDNGWGICFWECGFDSYKRAIVLMSGLNNSERISFRECVFQNGELAFDIYNWTGGLLIDNCSLNYNSKGEIVNRGGHVIVRGGHIETKNRSKPVCINEDTSKAIGKAKFHEVTFVNFAVNGNDVYLFRTTRRHNLILEDNRFSWAENERQQEIASRNTKITDDIGCIFIRNWQMSGKEGKAPFSSEGLIQSPLPNYLKRTNSGSITTEGKNGKLKITNLPLFDHLTSSEIRKSDLSIFCPIINSFQHRYLTWLIKFEEVKISKEIAITVYGSYENEQIRDKLGESIFYRGEQLVLTPADYQNFINNGYSNLIIEFSLLNSKSEDFFIIDRIGAIAYN
ncbi:hypothetical protein [Klebsiella pneumoniae]|uniref:hypothetical protein n=1 Tax=Klebsiella pneumoniae TaxID=573 RepID=UPI0010A404A3|nr:hypothetical protein [Klebsiella pneumoniae]